MTGRSAVVVEDDPDVAGLVLLVLRRAGFSVHRAADGAAGIELVRRLRPDLVTLDVALPDADGTELCTRIRTLTDAYVVMVSARTAEADRLLGLAAGADDYLVKPFSPRELQARVLAMFRRPRRLADGPGAGGAAGASLRHGPLLVDPDARTVRIGPVEVPLTRTEFELLTRLASTPHRVWPKADLLVSVWGDEPAGGAHVVDVHVGNLRRKLCAVDGPAGGPVPGHRWIQTVRGVGYRLVPVAP